MSRFLTKEEERGLIAAWQRKGDLMARDKLIVAFLPLVQKLAGGFHGVDLEDLIQEGNIGLMKAADRFDLDRGTRFSTCAQNWAWAEMREYVIKNRSIINGSRSRKKGQAVQITYGPPVISLDTTVQGSFGRPTSIAELMPAPELDVDGALDLERLSELLYDAATELPDRCWDVLKVRRLMDEKDRPTLEDLSIEMGVSRERVRQIENRAFRLLREAMGAGA